MNWESDNKNLRDSRSHLLKSQEFIIQLNVFLFLLIY